MPCTNPFASTCAYNQGFLLKRFPLSRIDHVTKGRRGRDQHPAFNRQRAVDRDQAPSTVSIPARGSHCQINLFVRLV